MKSRILKLVDKESHRQKRVVNLIASENYVSKNVLKALGSSLTNKYAEGKSHQRYYFGNEIIDELEDAVQDLACKVFELDTKEFRVNVQTYSGSIANLAVYSALLKPNDTILAMSLAHGGHLSHGHPVTLVGKLYNFQHYGLNAAGYIDYVSVRELAKKLRPKLIVVGASAYPREIDFKKFYTIARETGALLMADISHIAGLIAGKAHPSPFIYADVVTTTTQKTLRGPRGALIISRKELSDKIDKAVFPGLQGGPHMHTIAALGVALEEALQPSFRTYAKQVVKNAKALAGELTKLGFNIISGGTDNHLILVEVRSLGLNGQEAGEKLERAGIMVNKNMILGDTGTPQKPSGIRLGTPAVTTQGMTEKDMVTIAKKIHKVLKG